MTSTNEQLNTWITYGLSARVTCTKFSSHPTLTLLPHSHTTPTPARASEAPSPAYDRPCSCFVVLAAAWSIESTSHFSFFIHRPSQSQHHTIPNTQHITMHNTMATTLQHISDIYLHALLYHRSDQRYCKSPHSSSLHSRNTFGAITDRSQCSSNASNALITLSPPKLLLVSHVTARACLQCARCPERSTTTNYGCAFGHIRLDPAKKSPKRARL